MKLHKESADIYIPDNTDIDSALGRTTHLAIGAHQDDLEIFAYSGIAECYQQENKWFTGVTVTDGSGSSRIGLYADYSNEDMIKVRRQEQRKAAYIGEYSAQFQLDYPSAEIKDRDNSHAVNDILQIILAARPEVIYLHNPADKHPTHIAVLSKCIQALRNLPEDYKPKKVLGCEVWRDLDWMLDSDKETLDCSAMPNMASSLVGVFDSQISGGKRYDLATEGRRLANATYFDSHSSDDITAISWAMDLTPIITNKEISIKEYVLGYIDRFRGSVEENFDTFMH